MQMSAAEMGALATQHMFAYIQSQQVAGAGGGVLPANCVSASLLAAGSVVSGSQGRKSPYFTVHPHVRSETRLVIVETLWGDGSWGVVK